MWRKAAGAMGDMSCGCCAGAPASQAENGKPGAGS